MKQGCKYHILLLKEKRKMDSWHSKELGDGIMAALPSDEIVKAFLQQFKDAGKPPNMAVFTRLESEGRLHCEVIAYFSPAARELASAFEARPCEKPSRAGPAVDEQEDYDLPVWAGLLPMQEVTLPPMRDELLPGNIPLPDYVASYSRKRA